MTSVGINLASVTYWSTEEPFIDRFKTSGAWTSTDGSPVPLDDQGYPTKVAAGNNIAASFAVDVGNGDIPDTYVMTYTGTAKIRLVNATVLSVEGNTITFQSMDDRPSVRVVISQMSETDPIGDIHVVRTDQMDLYNQGEIFNPAFVEKISQFDTLRFMDWGRTNTLAPVSWDDRTQVTDASWGSNPVAHGVPLETMVALANEAHTDMWYNIPTEADDTYVKNALTYIRDHLDPSVRLHVEYSNEVWNTIFDANDYVTTKGAELFGADVKNVGALYYGYRSAQIAAIGEQVFGDAADARLMNVLSGITPNTNWTKLMAQGVEKAGVGTIGDLFTDLAVTTYFGLGTTKTEDRAQILAWAQAGDAGVAAAFKEMLSGGTLTSDQSIAHNVAYYAAQEKLAQTYGLNLVAYEGGLSLVSSKFPPDQQDLITTFFAKLANDPQMGALYTKMTADFVAAGGDELVAFNDAGAGGKSGQWGALTSIYEDGSPRYDALVAANTDVDTRDDNPVVVAPPPPPPKIIEGTSGDDQLKADGDVTIHGGAGNDKISSGTGTTTLYGGVGDDIYIVDSLNAKIVEYADEGKDAVWVSKLSSYTLGDNIETLAYQGKGNFHGIGNDLNNRIAGGVGNDILEGGAGSDVITGGDGDDILIGGLGGDQLTGGMGADKFVFASLAEIGGKNDRDTITDFNSKQGDKVDLQGVDANTLVAGDQAFTFIGTGAFTKHAGELNYSYIASTDKTTVSGDINGDGVADFSFIMLHVPTLTASDFIL
jgi:Ca2+-binding RTX toxin-like protein